MGGACCRALGKPAAGVMPRTIVAIASLLHPFPKPLRLVNRRKEKEQGISKKKKSGEGEEISSGYASGLRTWGKHGRELRVQNRLLKLRNICGLVLAYLINPLCALNLLHSPSLHRVSGVAENCSRSFSRTGVPGHACRTPSSSRDGSMTKV